MTNLLELPAMTRLILALGVAMLVSFSSTPLVKKMAYKVGAIDVPKDGRRMHDHPIPRLGGLAIALAFLLTVFLFAEIDHQMQGILLGAILILVLGILDDCLTLRAMPKLVIQILAATIVVAHGCTIRYLTNPFSPVPWDLGIFAGPITVIWIVTMTNAVNFIDGLDGLAVGVSGISCASMLVIALVVSEQNVAVIMAALLGACVGFIPYNFNPAKIFMGDTGSTFLGFVLAAMSIQGLFKLYAVVSFVIPFIILGVPFFDICFAIVRRLWLHQNPMTADRGHIHHRLIDMGFSQKQSVAITYTLTGILGLAAVLLASSGGAKIIILICTVMVVSVLAFMVIFGPRHRPGKKGSNQSRGKDEVK